MTIDPEELETFLDQFDDVAPKIRAFQGCHHLELWQEVDVPNVCTTYSQWAGEEALEAYRHSDLFRSTWATVKPLFAAPPEAHSHTVARTSTAIHRAASKLDSRNQ